MRTPIVALAAALAAGGISACAHGSSAQDRDADLEALRAEVRTLRRDRDRHQQRIEALEAQVEALARKNRSGETDAPAAGLPQPPGELVTVRLEPSAPRAQARGSRPATPPAREDDSFVFIIDHRDEPVATPSRQVRKAPRGGVDRAPPLPTDVPIREPESVRDGYADGIAALEAGDAVAAARHLERFLETSPRDGRADNAGLALGEALLRQNLPGRALQVWERVIREYPAGDAVPEALLRYGEVCREQGREAAARAAFRRLVDNHPGTRAAARAEAWLAEMK